MQGRQPDPRKWKIHRNGRGRPRWYQRWLEAWWVVTGKWSLHRAWQDGKDLGSLMEYRRIIINGGDLVPIKHQAFNDGIEIACRRIETCNDETTLICALKAARDEKIQPNSLPRLIQLQG